MEISVPIKKKESRGLAELLLKRRPCDHERATEMKERVEVVKTYCGQQQVAFAAQSTTVTRRFTNRLKLVL